MLTIRLKRIGRKNDHSYRVVLLDSKKGPQTGKINEVLGFYDPRKNIKQLKAEQIKSWIAKGAQTSDTVHNLLVGEKIITGKKINVLPKKSPIKKEGTEEVVKVPEASTEAVSAEPTPVVEEAPKE
jgi:small subunit ribosomal protein S16